MAILDAYSYYYGLGIAMMLGYVISSLRIERFIITAITMLPKQVSGTLAKKQMAASQEKSLVDSEESFPRMSILSGWTDENIFELERRAIFSKACFSFIVILGKDKQLRTFHNVCRHRAYAVTKKACGSSTVLGCRYHGWSYNTKGHLIKAPEFENVPEFDKEKNGLWEVKTEVREGMVCINFDARRDIESMSPAEGETILRRWGVAMMQCIVDWKIEASVNWKCLGFLEPRVDRQQEQWWLSYLPPRFQLGKQTLRVSGTTIVRRVAYGIVIVLAAFPQSANSTIIECSVFASKSPKVTDLETLKMHTSSEIDQMIANAQESRRQESSSSFAASALQAHMNELLELHLSAERRAGAEIHPAAQNQNFSMEGKADDQFCKELGGRTSMCGANARGLLDW
ncbi:hypothetical protein F5882DRAFT_491748 [Hyaloscypha sp. PMI_1271]|nr:hypothetical protein F5882DRAFT_491748 [Hyaloscypha sp. PMI_1271]